MGGDTSHAVGGGGGGSAGGGGGATSCQLGTNESCYGGPAGTVGVGVCVAGTRTCGELGVWSGCDGAVLPGVEVCGDLVDDDCDGSTVNGCPIAQCADLPVATPSGAQTIDPDGPGGADPFEVYCDMETPGGPWTLLYNSIGSMAGVTTAFFQLGYADRLSVRGKAQLYENFYAGILYTFATHYRDEVVDGNGAVADLCRVDVVGFDDGSMKFTSPTLVSGDAEVFGCHYQGGWASADFDADSWDPGNCSAAYVDVAQHYCGCWNVNLGADADLPLDDGGWGPHVTGAVLVNHGLATDGSTYSRVTRLTRWVRW